MKSYVNKPIEVFERSDLGDIFDRKSIEIGSKFTGNPLGIFFTIYGAAKSLYLTVCSNIYLYDIFTT